MNKKISSNILKLTLLATGLSGIVAEYILASLATYYFGDSMFQWAVVIALMMFAMGIGSRISKIFKKNLLDTFIIIELILSILVAFSALSVYLIASISYSSVFLIYILSIFVGILIGMEIPLVVRINEQYESLRTNISSALENDYYGSLIGGLLFAFFLMPKLGLIYTPVLMATVNFSVTVALFALLRKQTIKPLLTQWSIIICGLIIAVSGFFAKDIIFWGEQNRYKDLIVYAEQSQYQKIVMTKWRDNHWLYINGNQQLSTFDEKMYHEPLVHPPMELHLHPQHVLVLGGGDGCAIREIRKYNTVESITLVDLDPAMTNLGQTHPVLQELNEGAFSDDRIEVVNEDAYIFLESSKRFYDVIIIDLPDPKTIELGRLYSTEFYEICHKALRPNGVIITQAGSPYFATRAYLCIEKTMASAGFTTAKLHNQVITLGEWGWIMGVKDFPQDLDLKQHLLSLEFKQETKWINNEAMHSMLNFGKGFYTGADTSAVEVNKIHNPVLQRYYLRGNWDLY